MKPSHHGDVDSQVGLLMIAADATPPPPATTARKGWPMTKADHREPVVRLPPTWMRYWYFRYGVAPPAVAATTLIRYALGKHFGFEPPIVLFYPAVMLVALVGGFWPGVLAILLSAASVDYFFLPPQFSFRISRTGDLIMLPLFGALAVGISALAELTRRRNQQLQTYSQRLALATDAAALGIWEWNIDTNEVIWDNRTFEIFGVPNIEQVNYKRWRQRVHPDDLARVEKAAWEAIRTSKL